jgi:hypothetical protein
LIRSASDTEEPPYFWTTKPTACAPSSSRRFRAILPLRANAAGFVAGGAA